MALCLDVLIRRDFIERVNASATSVIYFPKDGANSPRVSSNDSQPTYIFKPSRPALKNGLENPTNQWGNTYLGLSLLY
jgi:hypothetical protein